MIGVLLYQLKHPGLEADQLILVLKNMGNEKSLTISRKNHTHPSVRVRPINKQTNLFSLSQFADHLRNNVHSKLLAFYEKTCNYDTKK